jgi:glycosyltransferase involved in cell wall biosynthesis
MDIWIITVGEPLPMDEGDVRLYRSGLLFHELVDAGHNVIWWTSSFDHSQKKLRTYGDKFYSDGKSQILLLNSCSYNKNISLRRIANHLKLAKDFKNRITNQEVPDVIICSFPIIELSTIAVEYANKNNIPIITDVRDLWPDIFLDFVPKWSQFFIKIILHNMYKNTEYVFKNSTSISAVSEGYLDWGLNKAGRKRTDNDIILPLGYPEQKIDIDNDCKKNKHLHALGVDPSKTILLFIGSFGKTYDLTTVIDAAKYYDEKNDNLQFVFCGDGEKYNQWANEAQGISNIIFTGWLDSCGIKYLLNISSIGLAAYVKGAPQGLPNKIFEYMSVGLPILSSLDGETRKLLAQEEIGLTYDPLIKNDLIKKIAMLSNKENYHILRKNSKVLFDNQFLASSIYGKFRTKIEILASNFLAKRINK